MRPANTTKTEAEGVARRGHPNGANENRKPARARKGAQKEEIYQYGELDNAIGGRLIEWGVTKIDGCRWLKFKMPDGRIIQVFIDWPNVW